MKLTRIFLVLLGLILSSCASSQVGELPVPSEWKLVSIDSSGVEVPVIEGTSVTLKFEAGGQAGGSGGCNSYGGKYTLQGNTLKFNEIVRTEMACLEEEINVQEQQYFLALDSTGKYEVNGDALTIWFNGDQGKLNFVRGS